METQPGQMNMEIGSSHSDESYEQCILNMQKKVRSTYKICINDVITNNMIEGAYSISEGNIKNFFEEYELRENIKDQLSPLFTIQPRFRYMCERSHNELVGSRFTRFDFETSDDDDDDDGDVKNKDKDRNNDDVDALKDLEFIINFCGYNLTELNIRHPHSEIMSLIRDNCPSLKTLSLKFKVIREEDFENAFSKMFHLEKLTIEWQCENATFPETLVNSLEQVGGTLKELHLQSANNSFLPDSLALVFSQLIALKDLTVHGFRLSESLIQSLDKLINLTCLQLDSCSVNSHSVFDKRINLYQTNLKNLETLDISWEYNVTDKFLIDLCNNSKKLRHLDIFGTDITDKGMVALNNLSQLKYFNLGLKDLGAGTLGTKNEFITDQSVTNLSIAKLCHLNLSNCTKISNRSVIELVKNLNNLQTLLIENTMVNIEIFNDLSPEKRRTGVLGIWFSFEDSQGILKSLSQSHNIVFLSK